MNEPPEPRIEMWTVQTTIDQTPPITIKNGVKKSSNEACLGQLEQKTIMDQFFLSGHPHGIMSTVANWGTQMPLLRCEPTQDLSPYLTLANARMSFRSCATLTYIYKTSRKLRPGSNSELLPLNDTQQDLNWAIPELRTIWLSSTWRAIECRRRIE